MLCLTVFLTGSNCVWACLGGRTEGKSARRPGLECMARTQLMEGSKSGKELITVTFLDSLLFMCIHGPVYTLFMCIHAHVSYCVPCTYMCLWRPEDMQSPGTGVTAGRVLSPWVISLAPDSGHFLDNMWDWGNGSEAESSFAVVAKNLSSVPSTHIREITSACNVTPAPEVPTFLL